MAGLGRRAAPWDRFSHWTPLAAMLVMALTLLLLVAAALSDKTGGQDNGAAAPSPAAGTGQPATETDRRDTDLLLYDRIAERVAAGDSYYRAAVEEQRAGNFPVRPASTVRLPTLALLNAWLGHGGLVVLAALLGLATLLAWWRRLGGEPGGEEHRVIALLLLVIGTAIGLKAQYLVLHEVWAGVLLALSFGLHRPGKWALAWLAAAAALAIREHVLPFILLMGAFALYRRDWRELAAWGGLVVVFAIFYGIHLARVDLLTGEGDPVSDAWLVFRGLGGWTSNIVLSSVLYLLPGWIAAPLALLPLLGWAGWKSDAGLFGFLLFFGYGVFFMLAGRDNNFYWALVVTPCWFMGLAFLPRTVRSLWNSARGR